MPFFLKIKAREGLEDQGSPGIGTCTETEAFNVGRVYSSLERAEGKGSPLDWLQTQEWTQGMKSMAATPTLCHRTGAGRSDNGAAREAQHGLRSIEDPSHHLGLLPSLSS